jgi:tRNA(adenine34) deaminase
VQSEGLLRLAHDEAARAQVHGDLPIGAIIVFEGGVLASRHEEVVLRADPTAHASLLAIGDAAQQLGGWRLLDCLLVATLEPCAMCVGAALSARVPQLLIGAPDPRAGACGSYLDLCSDGRLNHEISVEFAVSDKEAEKFAALVDKAFSGGRDAPPR